MPSLRGVLLGLVVLCATLVGVSFAQVSLADCLTNLKYNVSVSFQSDWCVFQADYGVAGFLAPYCGLLNNPLDAGVLAPTPSSASPSASMPPPTTMGNYSLEACQLSTLAESEAAPCIEAFYATACQSVCRRYNANALCFLDNAVFPATYCTDIEDKCRIFSDPTCILSPQGDLYKLLKDTSCVGGTFVYSGATKDPGFPFVTANMSRILPQLYPPQPPSVSPSPPSGPNANLGSHAHSTRPLTLAGLLAGLAVIAFVF